MIGWFCFPLLVLFSTTYYRVDINSLLFFRHVFHYHLVKWFCFPLWVLFYTNPIFPPCFTLWVNPPCFTLWGVHFGHDKAMQLSQGHAKQSKGRPMKAIFKPVVRRYFFFMWSYMIENLNVLKRLKIGHKKRDLISPFYLVHCIGIYYHTKLWEGYPFAFYVAFFVVGF